MTTLTGGANGATNNFDSSQLIGLSTAALGTQTTTTFMLTVDGFTVVGQGTGFTYSSGHPSGGTLASLSVDTNGTPASWSGFSVPVATLWTAISAGDTTTFNNLFFSGNDTFNMQASRSPDFLSGYGGNDTFNYGDYFSDFTNIDGGAGTDTLNLNGDYGFRGLGYITNVETIILSGGHDYDLAMSPTSAVTVNGSALGVGDVLKFDGGWSAAGSLLVTGGSGSDTFISGHGNDTFNGGLGADTVDYSHASSSVTVDLSLTAAQPVGGGAGSDTLISVENIIGSGNDDTLTGNASDNVLIGGDGHDTLDGGAGNDTVSYQDFQLVTGSQLITIDLRDNGAQSLGSDRLISIEKVVGSVYSDTFIGNAADNVFDGGGIPFHYDDRVDYEFATGGMAFTVLSFVDGNETVAASGGGQGADTLINFSSITGTPFDDVYYPLADFMSPDFDGGGGDDTISLEKFTSAGSLNISDVHSIEKIVGSPFDDVLGGDAQISGGAGDDTITGGNGDSTFYGNDGNDVIAGKGGSDTIYGGAGDDVLSGGGYALEYDGNDKISGGDGNDTLFSGGQDGENLGSVLLDGGAGDDTFWGADGSDTATYQDATGGVTVDLSSTDVQAVGGGQGSDTLHYVDNLIGSSFDDLLTSGDGDNVLTGGAGNDVLDLSGWHDQFAAVGHDTADGGTGVDTASYRHARDGVTVSLAVPTAQAVGGGGPGDGAVDTLVSIENLTGSSFADTLIGSASDNALAGGIGNDLLEGGAGNDFLDGGLGNDKASYAGATSAVTVNLAITTAQNVGGGQGIDTLIAIENLTGSSFGDTLIGDAGDNTLGGGSGNDILEGGAGNDLLYGSSYSDTASYAHATGGVTVSLAIATAQDVGGGQGIDTLTLMENLTGSSFADTLIGDAGNNALGGGNGNDVLEGGAGNDILYGGSNSDTASYTHATGGVTVSLAIATAQDVGGGQGLDKLALMENLLGSAFDDHLTGDGGNNTLQGGGGDDVLAGGAGNDVLDGGLGNDTASYAGAAAGVTVNLAITTGQPTGEGSDKLLSIENLTGSSFNDTLKGSSGDNLLVGGAGDDVLVAGAGNDRLSGGIGDDTLVMDAKLNAADAIDGGLGSDTVDLHGNYAAGLTFAATTMLNVEMIVMGTGFSYKLATDDATVSAGHALTVDGSALGAARHLAFDGSAELDGSFRLTGGAGNDTLIGGAGADRLTGGLGADLLTGGNGMDTFVYTSASESTGAHHDTLIGFDFALDRIDVVPHVKAIDLAITVGRLNALHFEANLATAVDAVHLGSHHAVLFTPDSGGLAGQTFLVVDGNGIAGYQAGEDLVFQLDSAANIASLGTANFI